jgi:hypothetical protein
MNNRSNSLRLFCRLIVVVALLIGLPARLPAASATTRASVATKLINGQSTGVSAAGAPPIEYVDSVGGIIATFAISGTTAFLIQGSALSVLDISAPAAPARISSMPLVWGADILTVADGIVYAAGSGVVEIIDARTPALPAEIARFRARAAVNRIQVVGSLMYLSEGSDGVEVVDVADRSRPVSRAWYESPVCGACFFVSGSLAYVASAFSNKLTILDIGNPSVPIARGSFTLPTPTQTTFWHVVVEGNRAYLGALTNTQSGTQPRLVTLDVSNPGTPLLLGNAELPLELAALVGNIAYAQSDTQLQLFDISDPAHPVARGSYSGKLLRVIADIVQANSHQFYLIDNLAVFKVLDVADPGNPTVLGSYATPPGLKYPYKLQIAGNTAYVLSRGLQVLDITNPISPTLRGYYPSEYALMFHVAGNHAYLDKDLSALDLLDISNPDLPALLGSMTVGLVKAVAEAANRAYLLTETDEPCGKFCVIRHNALTIIDISNPAAPQLLGRVQLFDTSSTIAGGIAVSGGYAYIGWGDALRIVDIGNPAAPAVRASYPITAGVDAIQLVGDLVYLTSPGGMYIITVANPLKPALLGQTGSLGYFTYSIQVQGSLAIVGTSSGVRVVDIADPSRPIARASYGDAHGPVQAKGDIMYVAGYPAGMQILRLDADRLLEPMYLPLARH